MRFNFAVDPQNNARNRTSKGLNTHGCGERTCDSNNCLLLDHARGKITTRGIICLCKQFHRVFRCDTLHNVFNQIYILHPAILCYLARLLGGILRASRFKYEFVEFVFITVVSVSLTVVEPNYAALNTGTRDM